MRNRLKEEVEDSEKFIREPIERFKVHAQKAAAYKRFGRKLNITEAKGEEDDETVVTVRARMDGYDAFIEAVFLDDLGADVGQYIVYPGSDMKFDLSNILMALEVDDFNDYTYICDVIEDDEINEATDRLMDALSEYDCCIKKAGEGDNLKRLTEIKQADELVESREDGSLKDLIRLGKAASKYEKKPNEKTRMKYIAALESYELKFGLHTKDKRILEKLKSGANIEFGKDIGESVEYEYSHKKFVVCSVICLIITAVCLAALFIVYAVRSRQGIMAFQGFTILFELLGGPMFGYFLYAVVGRPMIKRNFEKQGKEIKEKYDTDPKESKLNKVLAKYIMPAILGAMGAFLILGGVGMFESVLTENSVIGYSILGERTEFALSQTKVYQPLGQTGKWGNFEKYHAPTYLFIDENGNTYWFGSVKIKKKQKEVERIFSQNGIVPTVVRTADEIEEKSEN